MRRAPPSASWRFRQRACTAALAWTLNGLKPFLREMVGAYSTSLTNHRPTAYLPLGVRPPLRALFEPALSVPDHWSFLALQARLLHEAGYEVEPEMSPAVPAVPAA